MIDLMLTEEIKQQLADSPQNAQQIIDSTSEVAICITNQAQNFVAVNDAYCKFYGYSKDELIGKPFVMIVPEENRETMKLLHDKFMKDKREIAREWTVETKNGKVEISVDTAYSEEVFGGGPHKITMVVKA